MNWIEDRLRLRKDQEQSGSISKSGNGSRVMEKAGEGTTFSLV